MSEYKTQLVEKTEKKLVNGLEKAKDHAISKNGLCLSTKYINNHIKLEWKCHNLEHPTWFATTKNALQHGTWCPKCATEKISKLLKNDNGLKKAQEHASYKGGLCISNEYVNSKIKLEWKCHNSKHVSWFSTYSNVVSNGKWCPQCAKENVKKSVTLLAKGLKKAKEYAITQGGECLTEFRNDGQENLEWKCHNIKHTSWFALYNNVVNIKTWCPQCDSEKRHLSHGNGLYNAINHAIFKGGKCLSTEYIQKNKMEWKCHNIEHSSWFALYTHVINNGSWCPQCDTDNRKLSNGLEKALNYAKSRNGICLSSEYINSRSKLEWKCHDKNHASWFSTYNNVVNNKTWCDICGHHNSSEKKKIINGLEKAKVYANNHNGTCLSNEYINSHSKLEWKCHNLEHKPWKTSYTHAIYHNTWCPECSILKRTKLIKFKNGLVNAQNFAIEKGGECLSVKCNNRGSILEWKCHNKEHASWFATYNNALSNNTWCLECKKEDKTNKNLLNAQNHAKLKGGKCLSIECCKKTERLEWKCHDPKHPSWFSLYSNVVEKDCWCKTCNTELRFPKENYFNIAQKHAKEKKGECLSNEYIGQKKHMEWKCHKKEHGSWLASYDNVVKNGSWCPECRIENLVQTTQEFRVRQILDYLFKTKFIKTRSLSWNINNKTNNKLELDGYSKELNLAFEFQGRQHFEENIFKGVVLSIIQERDKCKKENCLKNEVKLIIIEELKERKNCQNFFNSIIIGIENADIEVPQYNYNEIEILYKMKPINNDQKINYKKLKSILI